jgi:hypothetical protein
MTLETARLLAWAGAYLLLIVGLLLFAIFCVNFLAQ